MLNTKLRFVPGSIVTLLPGLGCFQRKGLLARLWCPLFSSCAQNVSQCPWAFSSLQLLHSCSSFLFAVLCRQLLSRCSTTWLRYFPSTTLRCYPPAVAGGPRARPAPQPCEAESHLFSLNHRGCAYWALHCTTKHKSVFQPRHLGSEV